ncbi:3-oxoacyl-[acyl-carrier-protein] reductase [Nannocystis exedens]|uniref:3-oxoacyl-[acyl-carrier-protein] reductase n=1 Tax=Nannocystis exedens TaxID=54 RepID=A0A1I2GE21_9BACT|nr:3-oxoacyl-ACP reductase family protein [Nannocystis exedens]PCC67437.1 3-oxoacyl-ACP reductase [Nannocystis exedens]SFF14901.1 3-oxoacyl-[acyl-carrier-protein] reductase [Nannocystis exedens]
MSGHEANPQARALPPSLALTGRVALVTGASRGIGRAIARVLAQRGATVAINYAAREGAARELCDEIVGEGGAARPFGFDVADAAAVEAGVQRVVAELGGLHILVNNAGISIDALLMRASPADFQRVLDVNLKGAFFCAKAAARHLLKAKADGRIINISSVIGEQGNAGQAMYAAAKAGMLGLTRSLAREFASRGVTVNAVTPGFFETDMTAASVQGDAREALLKQIPLGRIGRPEEVAEAVAYLAAPAAAYVTGQVLAINGGLRM